MEQSFFLSILELLVRCIAKANADGNYENNREKKIIMVNRISRKVIII